MKHFKTASLNRGSSQALNRWLCRIGPTAVLATLADQIENAAVFIVDGQHQVLLWSEGAERLLGFSREEVLGQHCLKSNRCQQCMRGCGIAEHAQVRGLALTLINASGEPVQMRKYAQAFFDEDGHFAGGIEVLVPDEQSLANQAKPLQHPEVMDFHGIISQDPAMRRAFEIIRNVAETEATVLVRGESGTGKELVARALHALSHRKGAPFLAVNCAALTPSLLESELFGHVRGAFTGAVKDHAGLFQRAHGGTVFLDEVAELPLDLQAKLLRVLQERTFVPVGGDRSITVDVRIVAATHRALREEVKAGRFREDLMYRLRVVPIFLPPLRERRKDVTLLLWHFISEHNVRGPRRIERIAPDAMRTLLDYSWPGNVRELKNVVEYAFAVGRSPELHLAELPPEFHEPQPILSQYKGHEPIRGEMEAERIRAVLQETGGRISKAANSLGMSRATFWRKRKQYGL